MIGTQEIEELIFTSLNVLNKLSTKYSMYKKGSEIYESTHKVLNLLASEIVNNKENINHRILRAMHDIGMSAYKDFENTEMENLIQKITAKLYNEIPEYKKLKPLRGDFGKGEPI